MLVKRIVCLANSRKMGDRCIAGREIRSSQVHDWIRPVSARPDGGVSLHEVTLDDGTVPAALDIIDVPLQRHEPDSFQQENWLLEPNARWKRVKTTAWSNLRRLAEPIAPLWIDEHHTATGVNDKIPMSLAIGLRSSLRLIRLDGLHLRVHPNARVQARFEHAGTPYHLWVTDPIYEARYQSAGPGSYEIGECYATVSLAEPFEGATYKIVAAIMERPDS